MAIPGSPYLGSGNPNGIATNPNYVRNPNGSYSLIQAPPPIPAPANLPTASAKTVPSAALNVPSYNGISNFVDNAPGGVIPPTTYGVNGATSTGGQPISQAAYDQQQQTLLNASVGQQDLNSRMAAISAMEGAGATVPHVSGGSSTGVGMSPMETAARAAAFARAKEQAGNNALASLHAIQGLAESTGQMGSSMDARRQGAAVGEASASVGNFTRDQLMSDLNRSADVANTTYQGDITQRGQDLSRLQSLIGILSASGRLY